MEPPWHQLRLVRTRATRDLFGSNRDAWTRNEIRQVECPTRKGEMSSLDGESIQIGENHHGQIIFLEVGHDRSESIDAAQMRDRNPIPEFQMVEAEAVFAKRAVVEPRGLDHRRIGLCRNDSTTPNCLSPRHEITNR